MNFLEKCFKLKEHNTTAKQEIYLGFISFLAVAYILAVNPEILSSTGMDRGGLFYVTAIAAFVGTLAMAFIANFPFILAPAMGLNAFFAYSVVLTMGYSWQIALFAVVLEGIIFFLMSITSIREKIITAIPIQLKYAMGAGVGLFITLVALKNAYIIRAHEVTFVTIQDFFGDAFNTAGISAILAFGGILITALLMHHKAPGAILIGMLITWGIGMIFQLAGIYHVVPEQGFYSLFPNFSLSAMNESFQGFCSLVGSAFNVSEWTCAAVPGKTGWALLFSVNFLIVIFSFFFADFFDTVGTINGAVVNTPLMKKDGTIPGLRGALLADSIATFLGGVLGTSTTTTFAESAVGIRAGARTGLSALTAAILFLISLLCAPIFLSLPGFATAPALIIVGYLMLKSVTLIDWDDIPGAIPAYILIIGMVFTYNISDGLGLGIIAWTFLNFNIKGRVNLLLWVLTVLFIAKYIFL